MPSSRPSAMNLSLAAVSVIPTRAASLAVTVIAGTALACAGARTGSPRLSDPTRISLTEIERAHEDGVRDLYELIDRLRPRWLQGRNPRSLQLPTVIAVYHHETLLGGTDALRGYPLIAVTSIRYLDAAQAMLLPGAGSMHIEGAIVISTEIVPDGGAGSMWRGLQPGGA